MAEKNSVEFSLRLATEQFLAALKKAEAETKAGLSSIGDDAAKAGQKSKTALAGAFDTLDVRPVVEVRAELARLNAAYEQLRAGGASIQDLARAKVALKERTAELNNEMNRGQGILGGLRGAFNGLQGGLAALGIGGLGAKFLEANLAAEKLTKALTAITGSGKAAAADMDFLRGVSNRLGLDLNSSAEGFVKLAAAAKGTALEGQQTRQIFESVALGMSQLGLSAADSERAFNALGQMMSKGTVTSEELKGQLGDVLPGALQVAARSMGVTTAELGKMMEQGEVAATDFLPRFAAEMTKTFGGAAQGEIEGLRATINRLGNQWREMGEALGEAGGLQIAGAALAGLNAVFTTIVSTIGIVITGITGLGKTIGLFAASLVSMDFSGFGAGMQEIGAEMDKSLDQFAKLSNAALGIKAPINEAGAAAAQAGTTAQSGATAWETLNRSFTAAGTAASEYVKTAKASEEANNKAAEATSKLFAITGDAEKALIAKANASKIAADGSALVATATQAELTVAQEKLKALKDEYAAQATVDEAKLKAIAEIEKTVEAKTIEAQKTREVADGLRIEAEERKLAIETYGDQSAKIVELKVAYADAKDAADLMIQKEREGLATKEQVRQAIEQAVFAENRYRDALNDATSAIERQAAVSQSQMNVATKGLDVQLALTRANIEVARTKGDEAKVRELNIQVMEIEIRKKEIAAQIAQVEAQASLRKVEILRQEAAVSGDLSAAKQQEIQLAELAAQSKQLDADVANIAAKSMRDLADGTGEYIEQAKLATNITDAGLTPSLDRLSGSAGRAATATRSAGAAATSGKGDDGGGEIRTASLSIEQLLAARGLVLTTDQISGIKSQFDSAWKRQELANTGRIWTHDMNEETLSKALADAIQMAEKESGSKYGVDTTALANASNMGLGNYNNPGGDTYAKRAVKGDLPFQPQGMVTRGSQTTGGESGRGNITVNVAGKQSSYSLDSERSVTQMVEDLLRSGQANAQRPFGY